MPTWYEAQVMDLLAHYGVPVLPYIRAHSADEAVEMVTAVLGDGPLRTPLVMKIVSPDILHKSDFGGVRVGLHSAEEVGQAFGEMMRTVAQHAPQARLEGCLLYPQAPDGLELIVGVLQDASFGPVVMFGLGGVFAEALRDTTFRAIPIEKKDAVQMITGIKTHKVLQGWRGQAAVELDALADLLCQVSKLAEEHPEIEEMDLNPVRIIGGKPLVLDGRIIVK